MSELTQVLQQLKIIQDWIASVIDNNGLISDFTDITPPLNPTDFAHINRGGTDYRASLGLIASYINSLIDLTEKIYDDIPEMLADQALPQLEGKVYYVVDASADPQISSGFAYYEKLNPFSATLSTDYRRLSNEEVAQIQQTVSFYTFTIAGITETSGVAVDPGKIEIEYENVGDKITKILFNNVFTSYLSIFNAITSTHTFTAKIYNKTQKKALIGDLIAFNYSDVSNDYYKVDTEQVMDRNDLAIGDVVELQISVYKKTGVLSTKEFHTATSGQTVFNLSTTPENVDVYVDRIYQIETIDYDISNNVVTFAQGVELNSIVLIRKF